ncbi:MAG TPA: hypothetical protein VFG46_20040 [Chryseolinea sp.]|nr:hypothetical protein [Chryseolinea sp.]
MKTFLTRPSYLFMVMLASLFYASCSDPEEEIATPTQQQQQQEQEEIPQADIESFLESLGFTNSSKVIGSAPTVTNTSIIKMDSKDTIYTMPGQKIPVRISHPEAIALHGVYIASKNSTFYLDVPLDEEEDSDTVSVIIIEFPEDDDVPNDVPLEIIPYDQSKNPVDIVERIITIEEQKNGGCDFLKDGDTTSIGPPEWKWHYTVVFDHNGDPKFVNAPGRVFAANQEPTGCCEDGTVCPILKKDPVTNTWKYEYNSKVKAQTSYSIEFEFFTFFKDGTFRRSTMENIRNFNAQTTDWCGHIPAYNTRDSYVDYYGTHDYVPGDTNIRYITTRSACDDPNGICGYGSRPGDLKFSCHTMTITAGVEGTREERMYRRHSASPVFND